MREDGSWQNAAAQLAKRTHELLLRVVSEGKRDRQTEARRSPAEKWDNHRHHRHRRICGSSRFILDYCWPSRSREPRQGRTSRVDRIGRGLHASLITLGLLSVSWPEAIRISDFLGGEFDVGGRMP